MSRKTKYMSLFIVLAFTAGQVQYSYTSYFCTMLHMFLPSRSAALAMHSMSHDVCTQCDAPLVTQAGNEELVPNCFVVNTIQKDVVSTFVGNSTSEIHAASALALKLPHPIIRYTSVQNEPIVRTALSPPLDLPTLNSNLLI